MYGHRSHITALFTTIQYRATHPLHKIGNLVSFTHILLTQLQKQKNVQKSSKISELGTCRNYSDGGIHVDRGKLRRWVSVAF
jgi:hypothetical protein